MNRIQNLHDLKIYKYYPSSDHAPRSSGNSILCSGDVSMEILKEY